MFGSLPPGSLRTRSCTAGIRVEPPTVAAKGRPKESGTVGKLIRGIQAGAASGTTFAKLSCQVGSRNEDVGQQSEDIEMEIKDKTTTVGSADDAS
jgi:hypothetical protein